MLAEVFFAMMHSGLLDALLWPFVRFRSRSLLDIREPSDGVPPRPPLGGVHLYVQVPFGQSRSGGSEFQRGTHGPAEARRYFAALRHEIGHYHRAGFSFNGVSFGGGTPTVEPEELVDTIGMIRTLFPVREITVETNPADLRPPLLEQLRRNGVSRLSVGVRTFDDAGRRGCGCGAGLGPGAEVAERIRLAAGYFDALNVDLVLNPPRQRVRDLQRDLAVCRTIGANQVSGHASLPGAAGGRGALALSLPRIVRLRDLHEAMVAALAPEFRATSAWCFSRTAVNGADYLSRAQDYVGVGLGALSYLEGTRHVTCRSLAEYERRIAAGLTAVVGRRELSARQRTRHEVLMRLAGLGHEDPQPCVGEEQCRIVRAELRVWAALGAARRTARGWEPTVRGRVWLGLLLTELLGAASDAGGFAPNPRATARPGGPGAETLATERRANVAL